MTRDAAMFVVACVSSACWTSPAEPSVTALQRFKETRLGEPLDHAAQQTWELRHTPYQDVPLIVIGRDRYGTREFGGIVDVANAGLLRSRTGGPYPALHCEPSTVSVHERGAAFRVHCGGARRPDAERWTGRTQVLPAIECDWLLFRHDIEAPLVFADVPMERLVTWCCVADRCALHSGLRVADE